MNILARALILSLAGACAVATPQAPPSDTPVRMGVTAFRHAGEILAFEFAPDGKSVASIGADRTLRLWELPGGRELFTVRSDYAISALGYADGGSVVALAGNSPEVRFFEVPSGRERAAVRTTERNLFSLAFAPGGRAWAAGGPAAILLWENGTEAPPKVLSGHRRGTIRLAFSPDGRTLASAGLEEYACVWKLPKPEKSLELTGLRFARITALAFSPDGRSLATGSDDSNVRLWKLEDGSLAGTFSANRAIQSIAWSPDGKLIAAGVQGPGVFFWEPEKGTLRRKIDLRNDAARGISFSPDGTLIATAGEAGALRFWTMTAGEAVSLPGEGHRSAVTAIAVRRPEGPVISAGKDGMVLLWDVAGRRLNGHEHDHAVLALAVQPTEGLLASAGQDPYMRLWRFESGRLIQAIETIDGTVTGLAFTPAPSELLVAHGDRVRAWNPWTRKPRETIADSVAPHRAFVLDRTGRRAAWADARIGPAVLDLSGERRLRSLEGHDGAVEGVAFAGGALVSVGMDGTLRVWDPGTGASSVSRTGAPLRSVACSADGRMALTGGDDGRLRLWELATGKEIISLPTGDAAVTAVAFGVTDRILLAGTARGIVLAWDLNRVLGGGAASLELLGSEDPAEAYRAMFGLAAAGRDDVALLKGRLTELPKKPAALIDRLDDGDFTEREKAARELEWAASEQDLREALDRNPSAERRLRLEEIRKSLPLPRVRWIPGLFTVRAVDLLERVATPEARDLLELVARQSTTRGAREARIALDRLKGEW